MINQKINALDNKLSDKLINSPNGNLEYKVDKLIDTLAWWIPIRKWRNNFREKFKMTGQDRTGQDRTGHL